VSTLAGDDTSSLYVIVYGETRRMVDEARDR